MSKIHVHGSISVCVRAAKQLRNEEQLTRGVRAGHEGGDVDHAGRAGSASPTWETEQFGAP